jgi:hypothetical protein
LQQFILVHKWLIEEEVNHENDIIDHVEQLDLSTVKFLRRSTYVEMLDQYQLDY